MVRAVLFDLDDTLFDHREAARLALAAVRAGHAPLAAVAEAELEQRHATILEAIHPRVLSGELSLDAARRERFQRLFDQVGHCPDEACIRTAVTTYRERYIVSWREVAGASALLRAIRRRAQVAIVSNNMAREQRDKLRFCGFDALADHIVISEEAGVTKPDPAIFAETLQALKVAEDEAVMFGDAWNTDIAGARAAGIRPIWFNPLWVPCPDPAWAVQEVHTLKPPAAALSAIFQRRLAGVSVG